MKLKLPSWATITLGVVAGILAVLNQTTFDIATPWKAYVTIALVFLSALGISPLVGEKFQSAVHLAPSVGIVISAALAALAVGLSTLSVSEGVKGLIQGVIVFFSAFGFAPAAQYMLGSVKPDARIGAFTGPFPRGTIVEHGSKIKAGLSLAKPTIGRIVIYRSRTGDYDVPAIVTATSETLNRKGVEAGYVPDLASDQHVHLTVFTPGTPSLRGSATERGDFKVVSEHPVSENLAGCYQEWDIPQHAPPDGCDESVAPGTWRWPERVAV